MQTVCSCLKYHCFTCRKRINRDKAKKHNTEQGRARTEAPSTYQKLIQPCGACCASCKLIKSASGQGQWPKLDGRAGHPGQTTHTHTCARSHGLTLIFVCNAQSALKGLADKRMKLVQQEHFDLAHHGVTNFNPQTSWKSLGLSSYKASSLKIYPAAWQHVNACPYSGTMWVS